MKNYQKKWLLGRLKTSGSRRRDVVNDTYSDDRHRKSKYAKTYEDLPQKEKMKHTLKFSKLNYGLLVRFLRTQVGKDWDEVYAELIERIPTKLKEEKNIIYYFVADKVEFQGDKLWNKRSQQFIWLEGEIPIVNIRNYKEGLTLMPFFVHPETNRLIRIDTKAYKRLRAKSRNEQTNADL